MQFTTGFRTIQSCLEIFAVAFGSVAVVARPPPSQESQREDADHAGQVVIPGPMRSMNLI